MYVRSVILFLVECSSCTVQE